MINTYALDTIVSGFRQPDTGKTVEVYAFHASDVAGSPPNGAKIGDLAEAVAGTGVYSIDHTGDSKKVTIVEGGKCRAGLIGVILHSEADLSGAF